MGIQRNSQRKKQSGHKRVQPTMDKFGNRTSQAKKKTVILPPLRLKQVDMLTDKRLQVLSATDLKSAQWRVGTSRGQFQRWASGADESVPTRMAIKAIRALKAQKKQALSMARELNAYRYDNSQHIWVTGDKQIAGHVPAIKQDPNDIKRSVTSEHGRRDKARAEVVADVWKDGKEARHVASDAATIKLFMAPGEELLTAKPKSSVYANYKEIGDLSKPKELRKLAGLQQEVREHHKIKLAETLHASGRQSEIPKEYSGFVGQGKSSAEVRQAMADAMTHGSITPNKATTSQADLTRTSKGRLKRSLSSPRLPILPGQ